MNIYEEAAGEFLDQTGTEIKIDFIDTVSGFPSDVEDTAQHNHYKVKICRGKNELEIDFYGSYNDYKNNISPKYYDILCSLEKYGYNDVWEFASELGYRINSKKEYDRIKKIFDECQRQFDILSEMFSEDELNCLRDIK